MSRPVHPRSERAHEVVAGNVLARHEATTGERVELPVPIERIIEVTYGIEVLTDNLVEPPDGIILGALYPKQKRIVLNAAHESLFERVVGPERFTLAHELGHWIYDAEPENQLELALEDPKSETFCYHRDAPHLADSLRLREINANKLAAHLLLPTHLLRAVELDDVLADFRAVAARWGVSQQTLRIRLETLGMLSESDAACLDLGWI